MTHPRKHLPAKPGLRCLVLALVAVFGSGLASAQEDERSWNLAIALGHGERSNPLINGDTIDIEAVIDFSWYGERFFFDNGDFGFMLHEARNYSFNLVATFNNERNFYRYLTGRTFGLDSIGESFRLANSGPSFAPSSPEDGEFGGASTPFPIEHDPEKDFLEYMGLPADTSTSFVNQNAELADRDFALNGGIEFLYISPWGDVQAQLLSDVSGTHDGQEAWLSWSHPWYTRSNEFTLTFGAEWKSSDLVSYYYGVRPGESFPGRPMYTGGSGTNGFIRFAARHAFSERWHLVGMVEREFLSSAISNSPIVDETKVDTFFAGLYFNF
ncbi:MAG: MipA/OmpV family protein [Pseudomonadota bacterium]|nr:MipA/OmpV family protein [Pseudomonadota bacterium]